MSDLISRSALLDSLIYCEDLKGRRTVETVEKVIREQPGVDAKPVVRSEWIDMPAIEKAKYKRIPVVKCKNCQLYFCDVINVHSIVYNFCPYCGADMREKRD